MSILQIHDSKRYVFGCFGRARTEMAAPKKEKRQQGCRTPKRVFYKLNYTEGTRRVKENFGKNQRQCYCHGSGTPRSALVHSLTGPRAQRRAGGEGAGAHAEARAERRGNVAKEIAAAGAVAVAAKESGGIGAEPVAAGFALRIDALHGKAGQKLHFLSPRGRKAQAGSCATAQPSIVSRPRLKKF